MCFYSHLQARQLLAHPVMAGMDELDVAYAAGRCEMVIRNLGAQSQAQTEFLKAMKEDQVQHNSLNKTAQADMAEAMKQLAAQSQAQTEFLKAMKEDQARHNEIARLQAAYALASNGAGSFRHKKTFRGNEEASTAELACCVLAAFMENLGYPIPKE